MAVPFLTGIDLNNQRGRAFADPSAATDAATKQYVDALVQGLRWKDPVKAASTGDVTLAGYRADGSTLLDGYTLVSGDRVLLMNQTDGSENGIYVVSDSDDPVRASDANTAAKLDGAAVVVTEGSTNGDKAYTQTADNVTLGEDSLSFVQVGGGSSYTADGNGIELSGSTFSIELASGGGLDKGATGLKLNSSVAGDGLNLSTGVLSVDAGTGLEFSTGTLQVDETYVVTEPSTVVRKYSTSIGDGSATSYVVTHALGTQDVTVELYDNSSPYATVYADVEHTSSSTVTVKFAAAPASDQYRVVVHG